ncbi:MAG: hypothetical protein ACRDK4_08525 [Solirubrobacteraceae bacterium]
MEALDALLARERGNHQLWCSVVPGLSEASIERYCRRSPRRFARVLDGLSRELGDEPPFELCDEVARFYAAVFRVACDEEVRVLALRLLFALGRAQDRFAIGDVVRAVLWTVRGREQVELAVRAIEGSPDAAWYAHRHTLRGPLPAPVRRALVRTTRPLHPV